MDTKKYLYSAALKEHDEVLEEQVVCPNTEGKETLESYIGGMFGDIYNL